MTPTACPGLVVDAAASIDEVEAERWNALAGPGDFYQSHEWLTAVERDRTARSRYLLAWLGDWLVGALPLYRVEFEGSPSYRPERFRELLGVRGGYLTAGTRRCYRSGVMVARQLPAAVRDGVTAELVRAALSEAVQQGMAGIALFYLPTGDLERIGRLVPVTAAFDLAETLVEGVGGGLEAFLGRQPSKLRSKVRREARTFAATGWRTDVTRLADCLPEAASLVARVEQRHGHATPDVLLRRVFRRQAQAVDHRAVVFTCRDREGDMVACALNYAWRDMLYSRAVGLDYDRIGNSFAYFNLLLYRAIAYAAEHGLDRLHLGLGSPAKVERGAVARPLWTAAVHAGAWGREPGIRLRDPGAVRRGSEPYRRYRHALPAGAWRLPGPRAPDPDPAARPRVRPAYGGRRD